MKRIIRLTEQDLVKLVKRVINESDDDDESKLISYLTSDVLNDVELGLQLYKGLYDSKKLRKDSIKLLEKHVEELLHPLNRIEYLKNSSNNLKIGLMLYDNIPDIRINKDLINMTIKKILVQFCIKLYKSSGDFGVAKWVKNIMEKVLDLPKDVVNKWFDLYQGNYIMVKSIDAFTRFIVKNGYWDKIKDDVMNSSL